MGRQGLRGKDDPAGRQPGQQDQQRSSSLTQCSAVFSDINLHFVS